jgi:hypothetical protein
MMTVDCLLPVVSAASCRLPWGSLRRQPRGWSTSPPACALREALAPPRYSLGQMGTKLGSEPIPLDDPGVTPGDDAGPGCVPLSDSHLRRRTRTPSWIRPRRSRWVERSPPARLVRQIQPHSPRRLVLGGPPGSLPQEVVGGRMAARATSSATDHRRSGSCPPPVDRRLRPSEADPGGRCVNVLSSGSAWRMGDLLRGARCLVVVFMPFRGCGLAPAATRSPPRVRRGRGGGR